MFPGKINPRKMRQMMKQMGMEMGEIEGVEKVVIHTSAGNYVFEDVQVVTTTMQGVTTYQITGEPRFEEAIPEIPDEDITLVTSQTGVSEEVARQTLIETRGDIAREVKTYEVRPEFARLAAKNVRDTCLGNVEVIAADMLEATGEFDVVHLDLMITPAHIEHAFSLLRPGGYLACYTPFLEHTFVALDAAGSLFRDTHCYECMERELTRSGRGTRPSTRVAHSGYITVARK
jgi:alpha-NAC-related protein